MDPVVDYELIAVESFDPILADTDLLCRALVDGLCVVDCGPLYSEP